MRQIISRGQRLGLNNPKLIKHPTIENSIISKLHNERTKTCIQGWDAVIAMIQEPRFLAMILVPPKKIKNSGGYRFFGQITRSRCKEIQVISFFLNIA